MKAKKGFTLIELMVVILIVSILAAVAIPILRSRIDAAKWSEGKAMAGTIATAIRAYCAEHDAPPTSLADMGFLAADFDGTYFAIGNFDIGSPTYNATTGVLTYTIQINKPANIGSPAGGINLTEQGVWSDSVAP
jgi:prepilin-type N-terminal cleavage/methylation domain-containing protein